MLEKTKQVLELLEVPHLADREMTEMSSGEAHRLLIGRALVHDPLALLLDEPSNSLDFRAALELRDILRKLAQAGTGILMVTHHLPDILPEIDRVILLRQGRVFADGAKSELLTTERLTELFGLPVEAGAPRRLLSPVVRGFRSRVFRSEHSGWIPAAAFCFFRSLNWSRIRPAALSCAGQLARVFLNLILLAAHLIQALDILPDAGLIAHDRC